MAKQCVVKGDNVYEGNSRMEVVTQAYHIRVSAEGRVFFNGVEDTISYNMHSYTMDEVLTDVYKRGIELLKRAGYTHYKEVE